MSREHLKKRASLLEKARAFFKKRNILEVDCPILVPKAPIDANIDVISAEISENTTYFLHTSPEYAMKRLLSQGSGDIFYLGHVFRKGELGKLHNPEFTMAEWYRLNFSLEEMIQETAEFLFLFLGELPLEFLTYREAFLRFVGLDYFSCSLSDLKEKAAPYLSPNTDWGDFDTYAQFLVSELIEPHLGQEKLTVLLDFPPSQAALAKTEIQGSIEVAKCFEFYYKNVELTNGYFEINDAAELKARFTQENERRKLEGKEPYELDTEFLASLETFPSCSGVSVGFDRAFMLMEKRESIHAILSSQKEKVLTF